MGLPHARGGVSSIRGKVMKNILSSPRAWGCFCITSEPTRRKCVFPTRVGVFPYKWASLDGSWGLPHARGGVSSRGVYQYI